MEIIEEGDAYIEFTPLEGLFDRGERGEMCLHVRLEVDELA